MHKVTLKSSDGRRLKLIRVLDPISGRKDLPVLAEESSNERLVLSLPVVDYPRMFFLQALG